MKITCHSTLEFAAGPERIYELLLDTENFPRCFAGFGLIPAIREIRLAGPLAVGVIRHVHNADNSVLTESVTVLDRPYRHSYSLSGFQAPFSWLVKLGESDWQFKTTARGTCVNWSYQFTLTSFLLYPVCFVLLKFFMQHAMQRCLQNMNIVCHPDRERN